MRLRPEDEQCSNHMAKFVEETRGCRQFQRRAVREILEITRKYCIQRSFDWEDLCFHPWDSLILELAENYADRSARTSRQHFCRRVLHSFLRWLDRGGLICINRDLVADRPYQVWHENGRSRAALPVKASRHRVPPWWAAPALRASVNR